MITFLNQVRAEMSHVTWPKRQEVIRLTIVVIAITLMVGMYLGVVDYVFTQLLELIII